MIQIRPVSPADLPKLAVIYKNAYNSIKIGEKWDDESAAKLLHHFYTQQSDLFFVAELDGKIVGGIVSLVKPWWDGVHLTDGELFVDPNIQGKGIGTQLVKSMFEAAVSKYNTISWDTFTHRVYEHPLKWYKKMGFSEIKEWVMITGNIKNVLANIK